MGRVSICGFSGESPETRARGLFGLEGDAQPDLQAYLSALALVRLCVDRPVINHIHCTGAPLWAPEWLQMPHIEYRRLSLAPFPACRAHNTHVSYFLLQHVSNDTTFSLFWFYFYPPEVFDKGIFWSKPPFLHPQTENQQSTSQSLFVPPRICAPGLVLGGFLLAFAGEWPPPSALLTFPEKPLGLDLGEHQAGAAGPGCGTSGKLVL